MSRVDKYVAIDTNVFGHLINESRNQEYHINKLLTVLMKEEFHLLVDEEKVIEEEYRDHLSVEKIRKKSTFGDEPYLLQYWLELAPKKRVTRDKNDCLAQRIKSIITENEETDRAFVYVALKEDSCLISNDKKHIVNRRDALKDETKPNFCILTSCEAAAEIPNEQ